MKTQKSKKSQNILHECKWYIQCPMKQYYESGRLQKKWIEMYCKGDWKSCVRYWMEEQGRYHPDWMLPDGSLDVTLKEISFFLIKEV